MSMCGPWAQLVVGSAFASVAGQSGFWHLSQLLCAPNTRAPASPLLHPSGHSQGRGTGLLGVKPALLRDDAKLPAGPVAMAVSPATVTTVLVLSDPWSGFPRQF